MMQPKSPALRALHQGIQTELQGLTFYRRAMERTADAAGKAAFASLAGEEAAHLHLLKAQYGSLVSTGRWLEMERAREVEPGREVEEIFPQSDDALLRLLPPEAGDLQALEIALDFERKGYQTYRRLAGQTTDPAGRALYDFLAAQEQKHYDYIHRAHEYLQTQGTWYFDERELPMFEG